MRTRILAVLILTSVIFTAPKVEAQDRMTASVDSACMTLKAVLKCPVKKSSNKKLSELFKAVALQVEVMAIELYPKNLSMRYEERCSLVEMLVHIKVVQRRVQWHASDPGRPTRFDTFVALIRAAKLFRIATRDQIHYALLLVKVAKKHFAPEDPLPGLMKKYPDLFKSPIKKAPRIDKPEAKKDPPPKKK